MHRPPLDVGYDLFCTRITITKNLPRGLTLHITHYFTPVGLWPPALLLAMSHPRSHPRPNADTNRQTMNRLFYRRAPS